MIANLHQYFTYNCFKTIQFAGATMKMQHFSSETHKFWMIFQKNTENDSWTQKTYPCSTWRLVVHVKISPNVLLKLRTIILIIFLFICRYWRKNWRRNSQTECMSISPHLVVLIRPLAEKRWAHWIHQYADDNVRTSHCYEITGSKLWVINCIFFGFFR